MLNLPKVIKPWKEAGSLNANVCLYGFWNDTVTLTKRGDLMMILRASGVDYESLDPSEQNYAVRRFESAISAFGEGFRVYQYLFKTNRPHIPSSKYNDELIDSTVEQRQRFFEAKRDDLYSVEIFYAIVLRGQGTETGILPTLKRSFSDPAAALRDLRAHFSGDAMKTLLRVRIDADTERLRNRVEAFTRQLADFMPMLVMQCEEQFTFFRRLLNFDDWRTSGRPKVDHFLDFQVANSDIEAEPDHLRIGDHFARVLTMKEAPGETKPLILRDLLKINANFYAVIEWAPLSPSRSRKEVLTKRRHFNIAKSSFLQSARDERRLERDRLIDESKQAYVEQLGDCLRVLGEGQVLGDCSLTIVIRERGLAALTRTASELASLFSQSDGQLFAETYNQLNALFACVPGNYTHNLRTLPILTANLADISFLFTIHPGKTYNEHLGAEYLAVLETDNSTPYYLNLHNAEVAHTLITGRSGSGKSFFASFLLSNLQKYQPQTYVFDIGGSFESLTQIFGGTYLNVGQESRDFTINPFSLPNTKENLQFLASFFRVLMEGADQRFALDYKESKTLWSAIERMYSVPENQRTVTTFADIIGGLRERLDRWKQGGQYGFLFDNVDDTLTFNRFQTFNFSGWGDGVDALEPLLFYVLHRSASRIADPRDLATFKAFLIDEAWSFMKNPTIRDYIITAQKTWRKHNAAMILATQSIKELEDANLLDAIAESCPTKIFFSNPEMDREVYARAFHLNDTELSLIADLVPPGEMLVRKEDGAKKVRLNVDPLSYWIATNNSRDNILKREYFERFGFSEGIRRLAHDHPQPRSTAFTSAATL